MPTWNYILKSRREKWHLTGKPVHTLDEARDFIEANGFCLTYPSQPPLPLPTFVGAWYGSDERLPRHRAFLDPQAREATDLMIRLLRAKSAYEVNLGDENNSVLLSAAVFPYFYGLVGERNPRQAPKPGPRSPYSQLACDAYEIIHRKGPISKLKLQQDLENNWAVVAEAIQTVLRRENYPKPYEALKDLTRGAVGITKESMHAFIDGLAVSATLKKELKKITPHNYTGVSN